MKQFTFSLLLLPLLFVAQTVSAQNTVEPTANPLAENSIIDCSSDNLGECVTSLYEFAVASVAILAAAVIVWGGFVWLTSGGNVSRVASAKEWIYGAVLGLILALVSFLLLNTINPQLTNVFVSVPSATLADEEEGNKVNCWVAKRENGECSETSADCFEVSLTLARDADCSGLETNLQCARSCGEGTNINRLIGQNCTSDSDCDQNVCYNRNVQSIGSAQKLRCIPNLIFSGAECGVDASTIVPIEECQSFR